MCGVVDEATGLWVLVEAPVAMLLVDADGHIAFANRRAAALFDLDIGTLVGSELGTLLPGEAITGIRGTPGHAEAATRTISIEGVQRYLEVVCTPLPGAPPGRLLLTLFDRTRRQQLVQETEARCTTVAELSRMAMLAQLSASLAHEINQPLAAVLGNAEAGLHFIDAAPPALADVRECLVDIVASGQRAAAVMQRHRTLISGARGHRQVLALADVVGEAVQLLRNELLNRGLALVAEVADGLPAVIGNRVQLQQVVLSLVHDAGRGFPSSALSRGIRIAVGCRGADRVSVEIGAMPGGADAANAAARQATPAAAGDFDIAAFRVIVEAHGGRLWREIGADGVMHSGFELPVATSPAAPAADAASVDAQDLAHTRRQ